MAQGALVQTKTKWHFRKTVGYHERFFKLQKTKSCLKWTYSSWTSIEAGVPQESILGPLLFLIYINDPSDDLTTNVKLFADDTSLFSIVHYMNTSTSNLNNDLNKIKNRTIQWKMNFTADPSKQAQEVIFSKKLQKTNHNQVYFNHSSVKQVSSQKHLGMYLDTELNFEAFLPRQFLVTVYKAFIRPHLDYVNTI